GALGLSGVFGSSDHADGAGGHFTNTSGGVALLVEGSGIIESTAETDIAVNPHSMVVYAESNVELRPYVAYMEVRGNTVGTELVYVPVDLPVSLFGTQTRLRNVNICYKCDLATSYIDYASVRQPTSSGNSTLIIESQTNRTSTSWQCFDLTPVSPHNLSGPLTVVLQMNYSASGSSHDIQIGPITFTLDE
ncbi:MAG: hypothetical protein JW862_17250, partial [Anaerolineales bacterium]|nr:hypothetical protein [Anaerolineales bacterium]